MENILFYSSLFILCLAALVKSSDIFVESAEEIGLSFGISPFIIGVTIVAFGTSLPELASSVAAVLAGKSEIVVGNVVGSNITNICVVLGLVAVVSKTIKMEFRVMDIDIPILLASAFLLWFVLRDYQVTALEAIFLLGTLVIFLINSFHTEDEDEEGNVLVATQKQDSVAVLPKATTKSYIMLLVGGILVWLSATYIIVAIEELSVMAGIPPEIIAITFVAIGTSLPEIVVSIAAAKRGSSGIAVGNVLGSNIFNTLAVMSIPAFIDNLIIPESIMSFSLPFMVFMTLLFAFICVSRRMSRWEGVLFLLLYGYFMGDLVTTTLATLG